MTHRNPQNVELLDVDADEVLERAARAETASTTIRRVVVGQGPTPPPSSGRVFNWHVHDFRPFGSGIASCFCGVWRADEPE